MSRHLQVITNYFFSEIKRLNYGKTNWSYVRDYES